MGERRHTVEEVVTVKDYKSSILVTRSSMPDFSEYVEEIRELWDTHWLTNMGVKHNALKQGLKEYLGVSNLDLLVNGHMALELSIQALKLKGEVITTPFTFASTTHAIVRNGLTPVFCDIDPFTFCMDTDKIEALITDRTSAIIPVHVYGNICNVTEIQRIADKYGLIVLYDACHAFGETVRIPRGIFGGRFNNAENADKTADSAQLGGADSEIELGIGNFGDVSCFSFHATKVFNTIEGGAVVYNEKPLDALNVYSENAGDDHIKSGTFGEAHVAMDDFGSRLYDLKNFGIHGPEQVEAVGANAKMNEFAAAMGICNLRHVDECIEKRIAVNERYRAHLEGVDGLQLNLVQENVKSNYAYFPVIFDEKVFGASRNEVFEALAQNNIGARKYFYPLTNMFECYRDHYDVNDTPVALRISKRVLTLPMYADLALEDIDRICEIILKCRRL